MAELGTTLADKLMEVAGSATIKENCQIFGYKSQLEDLIKTVFAVKNVLFDVDSKQERLSHESRGYIEDLKATLHDTCVIFNKVLRLQRLLDANKGVTLLEKIRRLFIMMDLLDYRMFCVVKKNKKKLDANLHKFELSVVDYNHISSIREETSSDVDAEENQQNHDQANFHVSLSTTSSTSTNSLVHILKTIRSRTLGNRDFLKWVFVVLNVVVELCQATFSQVKNQGKMGPNIYFKLSIITSSICLMMAILEAFQEVKGAGIVWQKRGYCCWFYYPGNDGRLFGRFSLYFGLISSMIQLIIILQEKLTKKDIVKFDYIPLLLAICYLVAAIIGTQEKAPSAISIRCNVHGSSVVEGTIVEGHASRVFQCPHCQREREEDRVLNRC